VCLQDDLLTELCDFINKEVDVGAVCRGVAHDHPKEVGQFSERLVTDHGASFFHHLCFDFWRHLGDLVNTEN